MLDFDFNRIDEVFVFIVPSLSKDGGENLGFARAIEKGLSLEKFSKNAAERPNVDCDTVVLAFEDDFGGLVVDRGDFVRVGPEGNVEDPRKAEVSDFYLKSLPVDKDILRLDISMHDLVLMAVVDCLDDLLEDKPDRRLLQFLVFVQELVQVHVHVFEEQKDLLLFQVVENMQQLDYVWVA